MSDDAEEFLSGPTEAEGPGGERRRQTELGEAGRWKGLPRGGGGDKEEEEEDLSNEG